MYHLEPFFSRANMTIASDLGDNCSHVQIAVIHSCRFSLFLTRFIYLGAHFILVIRRNHSYSLLILPGM
jgi:hypothetical protein